MVRLCLKSITNFLCFGDIMKADICTFEMVLPVCLLFYVEIGCMRSVTQECCELKQTCLCNIVRDGCGNHPKVCADAANSGSYV